MSVFSEQRCFNHAVREAVAPCPQCRRFYCRECITEHEDRVLCAACLKGLAQTQIQGRRRLHGIVRLVQVVTGLFIAWMFFTCWAAGWCWFPRPSTKERCGKLPGRRSHESQAEPLHRAESTGADRASRRPPAP